MSKRDLLLDSTPQERIVVTAKTLFFPVILRLPLVVQKSPKEAARIGYQKHSV